MKDNNDIELASLVRNAQTIAGKLDEVMRDGTLDDVIHIGGQLYYAGEAINRRAGTLKYVRDRLARANSPDPDNWYAKERK